MNTLPPLLALAEGKKARPRKAQSYRPKEHVLHFSVAKILREHCLPSWRWTHFPAGELRDKRTAAKLKQLGLMPGWADFILVNPAGRIHYLELKRRGETLNDNQRDLMRWCSSCCPPVPYMVVFNLDQALNALGDWGCLNIVIQLRDSQ